MKKTFAIISTILLPMSALAQQNITHRKGILLGIGNGVAHLQTHLNGKTSSSTNLGINWKIGYSLTSRTAVLLNGCVSIYDYKGTTGRARKRDFGGVFPSVQHWVRPKIWVLGGAGLGTDAPVFYDLKPENKEETKYYKGVGGIAAIGYEVYRHQNIVIDLQTRFNYSSVKLPEGRQSGFSTGLILGINFY